MPSLGYVSLNSAVAPFNFVHEYNTFHKIKFARLARLVSQARNSPLGETARAAAITLASDLYPNDLELWVQQVFD